MSTVYKVTLKPVSSFYFGGVNSFTAPLPPAANEDDKLAKTYYKKRQSYFAKSEKLPQQTQLLGMLRRTMLMQAQKMHFFKIFITVHKDNQKGAKELAGTSRWKPEGNLVLGIIEKISPILIAYQQEGNVKPIELIPAPKDIAWKLQPKLSTKAFVNGMALEGAYRFYKGGDPIGAKDYPFEGFVDKDNNVYKFENEDHTKDIYIKEVRSHNQTLDYTESDEERYFKVQRYRLKKGYSFCFYVTLSKELQLKNDTVALGGEESYFDMQVKQVSNVQDDEHIFLQYKQNLKHNEHYRILLLSDTYINANDNIFSYCKASVVDKVELRTVLNQKNFFKSTKTVLLRRGSVLYPKDNDAISAIEGLINKHSNYQRVGYNRYIIL